MRSISARAVIVFPSPGSSQQSPPLAPKEGVPEEEGEGGARGSALESSPVARLTHSGRIVKEAGEERSSAAAAASTSLRPGSSRQSGSSAEEEEEEEEEGE